MIQENLALLKQLFPTIVKEGKIDVTELQALLGEEIETGEEYYRFTWAGKSMARQEANKPSTGTLRPDKAGSKDWDSTQNLFIEGDNLEVLKLLQKSYAGKVKMIYIDPPYNTGKDFVYKDNYADNLGNYLQITGQVNEEGKRLGSNTESDGRYHSNWLSMMYPRLKICCNLLKDDGVVFISIDDNELYNLRKLADEVFGEDSWLGTIVWKNATDNNPTQIAIEHEYIIGISKNKGKLEPEWKSRISDVKNILIEVGENLNKKFQNSEDLQDAYTQWYRSHKHELWPLDRYKYIDKGGVYTGSQSVHNPGREGYRYDVIHPITQKACKQPLMGYRFPPNTIQSLLDQKKILFGEDESKIIELKLYAHEYSEKLASVIEYDGRIGSYDLKDLFPELNRLFTNPKPVKLLAQLFDYTTKQNDIILDFFAGSGTTAQTVMQLNAEDGGNRKFICVQLPEPTDQESEAHKAGYKIISDITKERIRRAGDKIKADWQAKQAAEKAADGMFAAHAAPSLDVGFRAFTLDTSNIHAWDGSIENFEQTLLSASENIKPGRTEEDVLFEILLKAGLDLTVPMEKQDIAGKTVYNIGAGALFVCLATGITTAVAEGIGQWKQKLNPATCRVIFRDTGFTDVSKTNSMQILKRYGIGEVNAI